MELNIKLVNHYTTNIKKEPFQNTKLHIKMNNLKFSRVKAYLQIKIYLKLLQSIKFN